MELEGPDFESSAATRRFSNRAPTTILILLVGFLGLAVLGTIIANTVGTEQSHDLVPNQRELEQVVDALTRDTSLKNPKYFGVRNACVIVDQCGDALMAVFQRDSFEDVCALVEQIDRLRDEAASDGSCSLTGTLNGHAFTVRQGSMVGGVRGVPLVVIVV
jgi:hypothetical protein